MAGEIRGKIAEAITIHALKSVSKLRFVLVCWDEPRTDLLWKPDIFGSICQKKYLFLVTYSGSETHSKEKFWRNLAESIDAKLSLGSDVNVVAVSFKARMRQKLAVATTQLLDCYLELPDGDLVTFKTTFLAICCGKKPNEILDLVGSEIWESASETHKKTLIDLLSSIRKSEQSSPESMWKELLSSRRDVSVPSNRDFSVCGAIAKLSIGNDVIRQEILSGRRLLKEEDSNPMLREVGLLAGVGRRVSGEIIELINRLGSSVVADVLQNGITPTGKSALAILRQTELLKPQGAYIQANFATLSTKAGMQSALQRCFDAPSELIASQLGKNEVFDSSAGCWLYTFLKNSFAAVFGRQGQEWIEDVSDTTGEMRSILVGLHFPRFERRETELPPKVMDALSKVFADKLKHAGERFVASQDESIKELVGTTISNRLLPHGFNTLWHIVRKRLGEAGISSRLEQIPSAVSEFCGLDKKTGSTRFLRVGRHLVHCKLLTDDGRDHKVKEMFARSAMTRIQFSQAKGWCLREGVDKMFLVLDGKVQEDDLKILAKSWFDGIFYIDQLDQLVGLLAEND